MSGFESSVLKLTSIEVSLTVGLEVLDKGIDALGKSFQSFLD